MRFVCLASRVRLFAVLLPVAGGSAAAQDLEPPDGSPPIVEKAFVIVTSTFRYQEAAELAALTAQELDWNVDPRGLSEDRAIGLTFSRAECEESSWDFPCYVPRGRFDDGV